MKELFLLMYTILSSELVCFYIDSDSNWLQKLQFLFFTTGLSMSPKENKNGYQYFTYEHSSQYQQVQFQFYDAVESLDPQNIGVGNWKFAHILTLCS